MAAQANIRAVITARDDASKTLQGFSGNVESLGNQIAGIAKRVRIALGAAATAATGFAIKSAADFEQTRIGLENMLGSADKARVLLSDISKFAAQTPFEFPELAQATRQLVAFGFSAEDAFDTMKQLGNVSAAVGAPINDLAYLMGTLRAQGRAFTIDIRQFAQRGIPIYEYLGKVLKVNTERLTEMIEAGEVGFPEVQKAFQLLAGEGGKWGSTMERQSKSLSGLFSTLKDNIGQTARELVGITQTGDIRQGSLFDKLRVGIESLIDNIPMLMKRLDEVASRISSYLQPKFEGLARVVRDVFLPAIAEFVKAFGPAVGAGLIWALGTATDALKTFLEFISPVINYLSENQHVVWAMVGAFAAFKAILFIDAAVKGFLAAMAILRADLLLTSTTAAGATTKVAALRGALMLLARPWVITLSILGVGAIVAGFNEIGDAIDKAKNKLKDLSNTRVQVGNSDINVSGTSGTGLVQQLRNFFGQGSFRASGGPVQAGVPYTVGEQGRETFIPKQDGTILSNNQTRGMSQGQVINITVQAGAFMGSQQDARRYAQMIMDAYSDLQSSRQGVYA